MQGYSLSQDTKQTTCDVLGNLCSKVDVKDAVFLNKLEEENKVEIYIYIYIYIYSVLFSRSVMSNSLQTHELQHARPPCPSPTPRVHPNPCPLSR